MKFPVPRGGRASYLIPRDEVRRLFAELDGDVRKMRETLRRPDGERFSSSSFRLVLRQEGLTSPRRLRRLGDRPLSGMTIAQWRRVNGVSRGTWEKMVIAGRAPKVTFVGKAARITPADEAKWRQQNA